MIRSWQKWLSLILRLGFGILLIIASIQKILYPYEFSQAVENYLVVGEGLSRWVAVWLPYLETITGILLIIGVCKDAAVLTNADLMNLFLILVAQALIRHLDIRCGCFIVQGEDAPIGMAKLAENILFAGCSIVLVRLIFSSRKIS
ncbi:MAG: MauE/DoxX family redox-associated membrane protein [bacterium]